MSGLSDLYQEILLEHNSKPRNFRKVEDASSTAEGYNPLCGDQITIYLKVVDDKVEDVGFQGVGCAISRASASMMTQSIKGRSLDEAHGSIRRLSQHDHSPQRGNPITTHSATSRPSQASTSTPLESSAPSWPGTLCVPPWPARATRSLRSSRKPVPVLRHAIFRFPYPRRQCKYCNHQTVTTKWRRHSPTTVQSGSGSLITG